jgi:hypothetical protein
MVQTSQQQQGRIIPVSVNGVMVCSVHCYTIWRTMRHHTQRIRYAVHIIIVWHVIDVLSIVGVCVCHAVPATTLSLYNSRYLCTQHHESYLTMSWLLLCCLQLHKWVVLDSTVGTRDMHNSTDICMRAVMDTNKVQCIWIRSSIQFSKNDIHTYACLPCFAACHSPTIACASTYYKVCIPLMRVTLFAYEYVHALIRCTIQLRKNGYQNQCDYCLKQIQFRMHHQPLYHVSVSLS